MNVKTKLRVGAEQLGRALRDIAPSVPLDEVEIAFEVLTPLRQEDPSKEICMKRETWVMRFDLSSWRPELPKIELESCVEFKSDCPF